MRYRPSRPLLAWLLILAIALTTALAGGHNGVAARSPLHMSGDTFQPQTPPPGMVSKATAIRAAIHVAFGQTATHVPSGVRTRAYFGLYTDTIYSDRLVWIVRFWGPGLVFYGTGGPAPLPGTPYCAQRPAHEELVFIDGKTGKYLEATVGFFPTGLPTVVVTPEPVPTPCPTRPPHAMTPWSVAVGAQGNLFLGGPGINSYQQFSEVQKRSAGGRLLFSFSTQAMRGNGHQIIRIALDARGDVYVANDDNLIQKFGPDGHLLWQWFPRGHRLPQSTGWWNIAVAPDGTAYAVSAYQAPIYVLSARGTILGTRPGHWRALAVAPGGTLYATNIGHGLIQSFSPAGRPLHSWLMDHNGGAANITSIAAGRDGSVYVLDERVKAAPPYYEVVRYSSTGRLLRRIRIPSGTGAGQLVEPRDLAVGPDGRIYLADSGNPRILIYAGAGRYVGNWTL